MERPNSMVSASGKGLLANSLNSGLADTCGRSMYQRGEVRDRKQENELKKPNSLYNNLSYKY